MAPFLTPNPNRRQSARRRRGLALLLPCAIVVGAAIFSTWVFRRPLRSSVTSTIDLESRVLPDLDRWSARARDADRLDVVLLGDSALSCGPGITVAAELSRDLRARGERVDVLDAHHPSLRPIHFRYLLDDVIDAAPSLVVVEVNLRMLPAGIAEGLHRLPNLSRRLRPLTAARVSGPLAAEGLSQIDPWIFRLQERLDLLYAVDGVRELGLGWLATAADGATARLDGLTSPGRTPAEIALDRQRNSYFRRVRLDLLRHGPERGTEVAADVLASIVEELRGAGIPTLFFVAPTRPLPGPEGARAADDIMRRIARLRDRLGVTPAEWLDLHDILPADQFVDSFDHLTPAGCGAVAKALADRIVPPVVHGRPATLPARVPPSRGGSRRRLDGATERSVGPLPG